MYWSDLSETQQMAIIKVAAIALDNEFEVELVVEEEEDDSK